jgi:hypothetical protein
MSDFTTAVRLAVVQPKFADITDGFIANAAS